jgi:hypothetical protein
MAALAWPAKWPTLLSDADGEGIFKALDPRFQMLKLLLLLFHEQSFNLSQALLDLDGGLPLTVDAQVMGAVGVSGATAPQDGQAAKTSADALPKIAGH